MENQRSRNILVEETDNLGLVGNGMTPAGGRVGLKIEIDEIHKNSRNATDTTDRN